MRGYNRVVLIGNLTRDPELIYTQKGTAIGSFGLAINRGWTDANGEKKEDVTFVDVKAFGKTAETIGQYMKKGAPMLVEGRLGVESWEDKQTSQKRSKTLVVVEQFTFLGGGRAADPKQAAEPKITAADVPGADQNDDVPF